MIEKTEDTTQGKSNMDRLPVLLSAAMLFAIAVMPGAVAPGIVGAAAESLQLSESRLGLLIGLYFAGFGLTGASAYLWIREVNWRIVCSFGIVLMSATFLLLGNTENYLVLLILMFVNGIGSGMFGSPSITILGDGSKPEKGFSAMIIFSVSGAALLLALFPWANNLAGFTGVVYMMAGTTLLSLLLIPIIPSNNIITSTQTALNSKKQEEINIGSNPGPSQPLLAHLVMVTFTMGFIGAWSFFERIAAYADLSPSATSQALAIGTLFGAIGAPLAAFLRRRIPMYYCYAVTMLSLVLTLFILDQVTLTDTFYLLLVCSFQFWINGGFCLIMALIAEVDKVGRYVALIPASEALGSFIGPVVTGFALELWGVTAMLIVTALVLVAGGIIFATVDRKDLKEKTLLNPI